ncbi:beta-galactosidase [Kitasatospora aureofaciens]|uniref:beta-galactosidase n=1 Tax=Kitasatospora aureofaciens TaxID=1894 RepID=A0A1E7NAU8_KITAU|nr:beta-galactosidase [Kitasatospora aureofaciens]ARF78056.1 beta-galactosidase [Kitasatospora aureofaciens]OEV37809.1 beta-galactosidase [Kitasatospora aureofaciens]GGV05518.1 beta-galactosidase [Kitasatospora aureofaciens]
MSVLQIDGDDFTLDGEPFRIISGGLHYFRVHPDQWADRLRKARLMGLNTVETYVPWNLHQPRPDVFRLDAELDLPAFLDLAAAEGLHVLLRPGPYICAEWEGGGLPSWLLAEPDIRLRSQDPAYLRAVEAYFEQLLPPLLDRLATRGGPVLAVQVENEFGAYSDETTHLAHLADLLRRLGVDVPLFTCDQPADLARGALPGVLATANFGSRSREGIAALRAHQPTGPLMCTEFWIGWFDRWGGHHVVRDPAQAAQELDDLLSTGASVNLYMFHGGTSFGFTNGANDKHTYRPTVGSYDYDAPLDEAGEPTAKYHAFREVIAKYAPVPAEPVPGPAPKLPATTVTLTDSAPLFANLPALGTAVTSERPLTMEQLRQDFGYVLYKAILPTAGPVLLELDDVRDRAQVFVDGQPVGVLERESHERAIAFTVPRAGSVLRLLVENQGRVNYGQEMHDRKGLPGRVLLDGVELTGWTNRPLPLSDLGGLAFAPTGGPAVGPVFHRGTFRVEEPADTFVHLPGWTKGNVWVNGFHLGRHWSRGPQRSLYVPGPVLRPGPNEIVVLELHAGHFARTVELREQPDLGPTEE